MRADFDALAADMQADPEAAQVLARITGTALAAGLADPGRMASLSDGRKPSVPATMRGVVDKRP